jgi:hypothetical protein
MVLYTEAVDPHAPPAISFVPGNSSILGLSRREPSVSRSRQGRTEEGRSALLITRECSILCILACKGGTGIKNVHCLFRKYIQKLVTLPILLLLHEVIVCNMHVS